MPRKRYKSLEKPLDSPPSILPAPYASKRMIHAAGISGESLIVSGLLILTVLPFLRAVRCGFVNFDDNNYIYENPYTLQGLTITTVAHWLMHTHLGLWHPLTMLSLALDSTLFGLHPSFYHAENVAIHAANVVFLFLLLARITGSSWRGALAAAIFAVHPLRVESVAWIVERKDVLSALFGIVAIDAYAQYVRTSRLGWLVGTTGLMLLSLLAKPMLISLPAVLLLLDFWPFGRIVPGQAGAARTVRGQAAAGQTFSGRSNHAAPVEHSLAAAPSPSPSLLRLIVEKLPMVAIAIAVVMISQHMARRDLLDPTAAPANATGFGPLARFFNAIIAYARYLGMMIWPARLGAFYPVPDRWPMWQVALCAAILAAITVVAILQRRQRPWLLVGWGWYVVTLAPTAGFVAIGPYALADRYTYVPSIGIAIMLAWSLPERIWEKRFAPISAAVVTAVCLALCIQTFVQVGYWSDSVTLWQHCIDVTGPNWLAEGNLAVAMDTAGVDSAGKRYDSIPHYRAAAELNAGSAQAHLNYGIALVRSDISPAEAMRQMDRAIACDPKYAKAYLCRASLEEMANQIDRAAADYRDAADADPGAAVQALYGLGNLQRKAGRLEAAKLAFTQALKLRPYDAAGHSLLGSVLLQMNEINAAANQFIIALQINPGDESARSGIAMIQRLAGQKTNAPAESRKQGTDAPADADP